MERRLSMALPLHRHGFASLRLQPGGHLTEKPVVATVDGEVIWEKPITLPPPDCHVGDWYHLTEQAPAQEPLSLLL